MNPDDTPYLKELRRLEAIQTAQDEAKMLAQQAKDKVDAIQLEQIQKSIDRSYFIVRIMEALPVIIILLILLILGLLSK